jgi:C4-type Zn-finger protein
MKMKKSKKVKVKCPECGKITDGIIEYLIPFNSYCAYCENCNYHITESEWEEAK